MAYYNVCPDCGANLDPGEKCDCKNERIRSREFFARKIRMESGTQQLAFVFAGMEDMNVKESHS